MRRINKASPHLPTDLSSSQERCTCLVKVSDGRGRRPHRLASGAKARRSSVSKHSSQAPFITFRLVFIVIISVWI